MYRHVCPENEPLVSFASFTASKATNASPLEEEASGRPFYLHQYHQDSLSNRGPPYMLLHTQNVVTKCSYLY